MNADGSASAQSEHGAVAPVANLVAELRAHRVRFLVLAQPTHAQVPEDQWPQPANLQARLSVTAHEAMLTSRAIELEPELERWLELQQERFGTGWSGRPLIRPAPGTPPGYYASWRVPAEAAAAQLEASEQTVARAVGKVLAQQPSWMGEADVRFVRSTRSIVSPPLIAIGDVPRVWRSGSHVVWDYPSRLRDHIRALEQLRVVEEGSSQSVRASGSKGAELSLGNPRDHDDRYHSPDFRFVRWEGKKYTFNATQARVVRLLWDEWERGGQGLSEAFIADHARDPEAIYEQRFRVKLVFRKTRKRQPDEYHAALDDMIQQDPHSKLWGLYPPRGPST